MPLRFAEHASETYFAPLTIRHLLNGVLTRAGEQQIVYRDQATFTYRQFVDRIACLADMLKSTGVEQGSTVAVLDWDSHRYLEAFFAVPMMGAVLQTVNVRLSAAQIRYTLTHAHAETLIVHRDFFELVGPMLRDLPDVKCVIAILDGHAADIPAWACGEYEEMSAKASNGYVFEDFDENAVATTFYTTGTTGLPKGVCFTHRQLVLHTLASAGPFGASTASPDLGVDDVYMPLTPMFHVHAWGMPYVATMLGVKQVYPGRYDMAAVCALRQRHGVNYSHCVPTILEMLMTAADQTTTDLAGWKITVGGAALTRSLYEEGRARGMRIAAGYGMSETCPAIAHAACRTPEGADDGEKMSLVMTMSGVPLPLVDARIVDEKMNFLEHDGRARGELVLRAPWLTPCYIDDQEASEALWRGGWLHTQDIATLDRQGNVRIRDRLKDVIKTGGEWIDSIQLEELIARVPGVVEVSVIGIPDARWTERPMAVVVKGSDVELTLASLNAPIEALIDRGEISRYAKIDSFVMIDALPRTSVGKVDKRQLRAMLADTERPVSSAM